MLLNAGQLLSLDQGEYSDYMVIGFFVVLSPFDPKQELSTYLEKYPEQKERYSFESNQFLAELIKKGLLLEIEYKTLYLGSYANYTDFDVFEKK